MSASIPTAWGIAWRIVWLAFVAWLIVTLISQYSGADVRAVCTSHSGVAQVVDTTWTGGDGKATVVCRDGWVGQIQ